MIYCKRKTIVDIVEGSKVSQEFSELVTDYILNDKTGELEVSPTPKNVQEYIQSFEKCALESILNSFSVPNAIEDDNVRDYTAIKTDLSAVGEAFEVAENYRDRLGLGDDLSVAEVFSRMKSYAADLEAKLKASNDNNKEGKGDDEAQTGE